MTTINQVHKQWRDEGGWLCEDLARLKLMLNWMGDGAPSGSTTSSHLPPLQTNKNKRGARRWDMSNMKHEAPSDSLLQIDKQATNDTTAFDQTPVCKKPEPLTHYKWSASMLQTLTNYNRNHKPRQNPNPRYKAFIQREKYTCQHMCIIF
jgi:hypothetical protein